MSFFLRPDEMVSAMNEFEKTRSRPYSELPAAMPKEMAAAVNLLAHPMAGFAAASALGFGFASQMAGIWMGSVVGAVEAAQRMGSLAADVVPEPSRAAERAKAATDTLIADVKSRARQVADTAAKRAAEAAKPAGSTARRKTQAAVAATEPTVKDAPAGGTAMVKVAAAEKPASPDDLKAISGIGPKLEQVLNGMGVWTYGQIAAWTPEQVAWVDDQLGFAGRIGRDDWIGQARQLSDAKAK